MGPRQLGFIRRALTQVYTNLGILTSDPEVINHAAWGHLQDSAEVAALQEWRDQNHLPGTAFIRQSLADLQPGELQALGVWRSRQADVRNWVERLKIFYATLPRGDQASRASLEGVLLRLEQFAEGQMAWQYGAGPDSIPVEDLGLLGPSSDPWGLLIVEGGAEMDEYPKAALLALLSSVLYFDGVVRRRESLAGARFPAMQIFFEEANKVLTGVSGAAADQNASGGNQEQVSEVFQTFWRDGRKYKIFLHLIAQTVSALPPGILSSCNNGYLLPDQVSRRPRPDPGAYRAQREGHRQHRIQALPGAHPAPVGDCQTGLQRRRDRAGTSPGPSPDGSRQRAFGSANIGKTGCSIK